MPTVRRDLAVPVSLLAALLAALLAVALSAAPASASGPPLEGSGTGLVTALSIDSVRAAGSNSIQERTLTGTVDGVLRGTWEQQVRGVVHDGRLVTFQGTMTFSGTLEGCGAGTITLGVSGRGTPGAAPVTEAQVRVIDQPSNTIDVTGVGTVEQTGPFMTYDIRFVCR
jgi:hypothetical protein